MKQRYFWQARDIFYDHVLLICVDATQLELSFLLPYRQPIKWDAYRGVLFRLVFCCVASV